MNDVKKLERGMWSYNTQVLHTQQQLLQSLSFDDDIRNFNLNINALKTKFKHFRREFYIMDPMLRAAHYKMLRGEEVCDVDVMDLQSHLRMLKRELHTFSCGDVRELIENVGELQTELNCIQARIEDFELSENPSKEPGILVGVLQMSICMERIEQLMESVKPIEYDCVQSTLETQIKELEELIKENE